MKKVLRIAGIILGIILLIVLCMVVAIQHPKVQGALAKKAIEKFAKNIDGTFSFDEMSVKPFDAVVLRNVVLTDNNPLPGSGADTLAKVGFLSAKFSAKGLLHGEAFYLERATLKDGEFNLVTEPNGEGKSTTNVQRVFGIKSSGKNNNDWGDILHAGRLDIENFRYTMKLMNDGTLKSSDGSHINFNDLDLIANISVRNLDVEGGYVKADVKHLDMTEKSGFRLENASANVKVGKEAALIDNLILQDGESDLHLNYLRFLGKIKDYSDFIHNIRIQADIAEPSVLAMSTISNFGPGMDKIGFKSELKGKSMRKAICERAGQIFVAVSETDESMHDFAQALVDMGVRNAVYLVGSHYSFGWVRETPEAAPVLFGEDLHLPAYKNETYIIWMAD